MLTCLVLVDDPPRCSECRKKIVMIYIKNNTYEVNHIVNSDELNLKLYREKNGKI